MITIHKFQLSEKTTITLPEGSKALSVGFLGPRIYMWVKVDTDMPPEDREFRVFATGEDMQPADWDGDFEFIASTGTGMEYHVFGVSR